jgi:hypothetical protein
VEGAFQMTVTAQRPANLPASSGLADVVGTILDKGLVIDSHIQVSVVGIDLLTIRARIVVASVDTYLRFADAVNSPGVIDSASEQPGVAEDARGVGARQGDGAITAGVDDDLGSSFTGLEESVDQGRTADKTTQSKER